MSIYKGPQYELKIGGAKFNLIFFIMEIRSPCHWSIVSNIYPNTDNRSDLLFEFQGHINLQLVYEMNEPVEDLAVPKFTNFRIPVLQCLILMQSKEKNSFFQRLCNLWIVNENKIVDAF